VFHIAAEFSDFSDTAAVMADLDVIVTTDTSVAHLAGALGRPLWIMLSYVPDWRFGLDAESNRWYPTARLFRQPAAGDWGAVLNQVQRELTTLAASR
jgi:ADP-heptose:LPS heptosyltransferase